MTDIKAENLHPDKSTLLADIEDYLVELNENELNSICGGIQGIDPQLSGSFGVTSGILNVGVEQSIDPLGLTYPSSGSFGVTSGILNVGVEQSINPVLYNL